jgi:hypothetical protein
MFSVLFCLQLGAFDVGSDRGGGRSVAAWDDIYTVTFSERTDR